MKQFSKDLGNVSLAPKGKWSKEQEYERLALVYNACDNLSYVAKINVPIGVEIDNREYWQPMNATGYADNNFINLTTENENGTITAYESLEEAVATILPINRRAGATLSFFNLNADRLDRQAEFELWQFNSTDLANWENRDYWNNIYYNWNVFVGWYIGADALKNHVETPNVGQYAYVGSNLNDAILYQCRTNGTWTNTGIKVRNYISVVVSGNITIGDNGNWFSDGKDTGIPATPAVDEQLDNIIMQLQQHTTEISSLKASDVNLQDQITSNDSDITNLTAKHESLSRTVQGIAATGGASTANNVTYNNDSSGLNAENAQDAIDELQGSKADNLNINPLSNNKVFNDAIKEMYTSVDLSRVTKVQISKDVEYKGKYNNIIRFITDDRKYIIFYIHQSISTQEESLAELKPFYENDGNYCVIDWSKIEDGVDYNSSIVLNSERIQNLEFNPYIAGYIKGKELKADIQNIDKTNKSSIGSTSSLFKSGITNYQKPNTDIVNFIIYGQSLSTGQQTCPELSRENYNGNLMIGQYEWISGVGSNTKDAINLLKATSTKGKNYIPTGSLDQTNGETPNVNFANGVKCMLDDYTLNLVDRKILACSCGMGGQSIELLSKDCPNNSGGRYNQFIGALNTIKTLVDAESKTLSCGCVIWMQGEYNAAAEKNQGWQSNTPATNNKDDYKAYLLGGKTSDNVMHNGLINDIIEDIKSVYSQENSPIVLCSQIGPNFNKSFENPIDMALLEANNGSNLITLVAPSYCVTDRGGHLDPNGTRWLGEYYNKVWYNKVILGNNWKPLQPNKIIKGNNYLDIRFDVPVPPLKFDTYLVREKPNYGFSVKSNGINAIISNIDIISNDTVRITCNTDFEGDVEVAYATVGIVYGNLRDSDPWESFEKYKNLDKIVENPEGVSYLPSWQPKDEKGNIIYDKKYPCYNWCMRFYYKLLSNKSELNINTGL